MILSNSKPTFRANCNTINFFLFDQLLSFREKGGGGGKYVPLWLRHFCVEYGEQSPQADLSVIIAVPLSGNSQLINCHTSLEEFTNNKCVANSKRKDCLIDSVGSVMNQESRVQYLVKSFGDLYLIV